MVYVLVGVVSATIDFLTLALLIKMGLKQFLAVSIAYALGFIFNIKAHARFTFESQLNKKTGQDQMATSVLKLELQYNQLTATMAA